MTGKVKVKKGAVAVPLHDESLTVAGLMVMGVGMVGIGAVGVEDVDAFPLPIDMPVYLSSVYDISTVYAVGDGTVHWWATFPR